MCSMRSANQSRPQSRASMGERWLQALHESDATFAGEGFAERLLDR